MLHSLLAARSEIGMSTRMSTPEPEPLTALANRHITTSGYVSDAVFEALTRRPRNTKDTEFKPALTPWGLPLKQGQVRLLYLSHKHDCALDIDDTFNIVMLTFADIEKAHRTMLCHIIAAVLKATRKSTSTA